VRGSGEWGKVGGGLPCLWRDGRRAITIAITRLQLLVTYGQPTSAVAVAPVALAVADEPVWAAGRAWTTWLSGPASEGRSQRLVNDSSVHWQCVVEKQSYRSYDGARCA
jgi:hypothetical protein